MHQYLISQMLFSLVFCRHWSARSGNVIIFCIFANSFRTDAINQTVWQFLYLDLEVPECCLGNL